MASASPVRCDEKQLSQWSGSGAVFGRYDYRHTEHRLNDMLNDDYFGNATHLLRIGDYITIIDCEDQILTVRIDYLDRHSMKAHLSRIERLYALPVVALRDDIPNDPGLVWKWRSRAGGGHSIMTAKGEVLAINFPTREVADQAIRIMYDRKVFAAPPGHEPTKQYVRDAPVYKEG